MAFLPCTRQVAASIGYCRAWLASELNVRWSCQSLTKNWTIWFVSCATRWRLATQVQVVCGRPLPSWPTFEIHMTRSSICRWKVGSMTTSPWSATRGQR